MLSRFAPSVSAYPKRLVCKHPDRFC